MLTLEQVRKAGRPAICGKDRHYFYRDGKVQSAWTADGTWGRVGSLISSNDMLATARGNRIDQRCAPRTGWHHLPDCDCDFYPRCQP